MCLSVQGEVLQVDGTFAWVRSLGQPVRVSIAAVPAVQPGEWVLIRAGMALDVLSAAEAQELDAFSQQFLALFEQGPENLDGPQIPSSEPVPHASAGGAEAGSSSSQPSHPSDPSHPVPPTHTSHTSQGGREP